MLFSNTHKCTVSFVFQEVGEEWTPDRQARLKMEVKTSTAKIVTVIKTQSPDASPVRIMWALWFWINWRRLTHFYWKKKKIFYGFYWTLKFNSWFFFFLLKQFSKTVCMCVTVCVCVVCTCMWRFTCVWRYMCLYVKARGWYLVSALFL